MIGVRVAGRGHVRQPRDGRGEIHLAHIAAGEEQQSFRLGAEEDALLQDGVFVRRTVETLEGRLAHLPRNALVGGGEQEVAPLSAAHTQQIRSVAQLNDVATRVGVRDLLGDYVHVDVRTGPGCATVLRSVQVHGGVSGLVADIGFEEVGGDDEDVVGEQVQVGFAAPQVIVVLGLPGVAAIPGTVQDEVLAHGAVAVHLVMRVEVGQHQLAGAQLHDVGFVSHAGIRHQTMALAGDLGGQVLRVDDSHAVFHGATTPQTLRPP